MSGLVIWGVPEEQAEAHRTALRDLRKELEHRGLRTRLVERLQLPMSGGYCKPARLPPELDVYAAGRLLATVTVVDVPGGGGAWYLLKEPGGLPSEAHSVSDPAAAAGAVTVRRTAPGRESPVTPRSITGREPT
ncbi:hypothetical protein Sru01_06730 [Sphaerisporangium rufum]|uniref:Uncharacterized protein n=1 Tax=Sphaerisporangium rufum TaxID=1381558 RepID=A0A919QZL9_9ACTN|nr:hypothetical protein [Sphaerisporangium rufum]GII75691.1 hypothetical protein Sru01_06730 [Sphaerisporangium rufum]